MSQYFPKSQINSDAGSNSIYAGAYDPRVILVPAIRGCRFFQLDKSLTGPINTFVKQDNDPNSFNWVIDNTEGPQGPQGPQGLQGPQGVPGPPGPPGPSTLDPNLESYFFDDFFIGLNTSLGWQLATAGAGSGANTGTYGIGSVEKPLGIIRINTNNANGRVSLSRANNGLIFGYTFADQTWRIALEDLGSPTQNFVVYVGFHDAITAGVPVDGVYFVYAQSLGPNWLCITRNSNVQTTIDSGVAANLNYNRFRTTVNETGTEANFFINDVLVGTSTTNIPNTFNRRTGPTCKIETITGSSPKILNVDYYYEKYTFTGGRS